MTDLVPPQSLDAERAVLGACLMDNRVIDLVRAIIGPDDFYHSKHRRVFEVICQLADKSEPVDMLTVADALKAQSVPDGGIDLLKNLEAGVPAIANVEVYARRVREKARLRRLIALCGKYAAQAYQGPEDTQAALDGAAAAFLDLSVGQSETGRCTLAAATGQAIRDIGSAMDTERGFAGLSTGFKTLDFVLGGLKPGHLDVIAGRPGWGKTALAWNIAENVARARVGVGVFSLEMTETELALRFISKTIQVDSKRLEQPRGGNGRAPLNEQEFTALGKAAAYGESLPIYIYDQPHVSVTWIRAQARKLKADLARDGIELGLLIVDYLQLVDAALQGRGHNREQEVAAVSRGLKGLAKELTLTVLACVQLNRANEGRQDRRPTLADLRESGQIEQDADVIMFPYRERNGNEMSNAAEVIIGKQRGGSVTSVSLTYLPQYTTFLTPAGESSYSRPADNPPHWQEDEQDDLRF